jgi:CHAD domain-containing protein
MAFTFDPREPLGEEVRKVARSQVRKLNRALEQPERLGIEESIHDARKRAKKLRALARLVRPGLDDLYKPTNRCFRDAAGELAEARDAHVMLETLDALTGSVPEHERCPDVSAARAELAARKQRINLPLDRDSAEFAAARLLAAEGADLVESWRIDADFEVIAGGFNRTYERMAKAFQRCQAESTAAAFHEWRKRAKYHRYHLELLRSAYPLMTEPWIDEMHRLTDALGEHHDLSVLTARVSAQPELFGPDEADAIVVLAEGRSSILRRQALSLGARLAVEDPACVTNRLRGWWNATRNFGEEFRRTSLDGSV